MRDYPAMTDHSGHSEPAPRRVRGFAAGKPVFDTTDAVYVWEWPNYPQYYIPLRDVDSELLVDEGHEQKLKRGNARRHGLRAGAEVRPGAARVYAEDADADVAGRVRFEWESLDAWFEEDEQVYVHPRNPYTRVDALRSTRRVRVEVEGVVLAESSSPVMVFETGLPTRYYVNRTEVDFAHLVRTDTETECPYKGRTTDYWSIRIGETVHADLAWAYGFPTRQLLPIAGLVAFYNEKVDLSSTGSRSSDQSRTSSPRSNDPARQLQRIDRHELHAALGPHRSHAAVVGEVEGHRFAVRAEALPTGDAQRVVVDHGELDRLVGRVGRRRLQQVEATAEQGDVGDTPQVGEPAGETAQIG